MLVPFLIKPNCKPGALACWPVSGQFLVSSHYQQLKAKIFINNKVIYSFLRLKFTIDILSLMIFNANSGSNEKTILPAILYSHPARSWHGTIHLGNNEN